MSFTRSSLIEVFTKKAKDFVSLDFLACDANSSVKECIDKIQKEKKSTILILKEKKINRNNYRTRHCKKNNF